MYAYRAPSGVWVTSVKPEPRAGIHEWPPFYYFWSAAKFLRGLYRTDPAKVERIRAGVQGDANRIG